MILPAVMKSKIVLNSKVKQYYTFYVLYNMSMPTCPINGCLSKLYINLVNVFAAIMTKDIRVVATFRMRNNNKRKQWVPFSKNFKTFFALIKP